MTVNSGELKFLRINKIKVLIQLTQSLKETFRSFVLFGMEADFSKDNSDGRMAGPFTDTGVARMLQKSDYDAIDIYLPFSVAVADTWLQNSEGAPVALVFSMNLELVYLVCRRFWTQHQDGKNTSWLT